MCSAACLAAANGTITPNEWFAVGSSSAAATAGAARSPLSYTIASGCQPRATSRSSGSFEVAWPSAKMRLKRCGRRSPSGSA